MFFLGDLNDFLFWERSLLCQTLEFLLCMLSPGGGGIHFYCFYAVKLLFTVFRVKEINVSNLSRDSVFVWQSERKCTNCFDFYLWLTC